MRTNLRVYVAFDGRGWSVWRFPLTWHRDRRYTFGGYFYGDEDPDSGWMTDICRAAAIELIGEQRVAQAIPSDRWICVVRTLHCNKF